MILAYGSYAHAANEASIQVAHDYEFDETGRARLRRDTFTITGELQLPSPTGTPATDQASLTTAINALKTAYNTNGNNLILYLADGSTSTSHSILSNNTTTGTRVRSIRFPKGDGDEYAISRQYEIVVDAETLLSGTSNVRSYRESVQVIGTGGPIFIHLPTLTGLWQRQIIHQASLYRVIQSGTAIGAFQFPTANPPLFSFGERGEERSITREGPEYINGRYTNYSISWTYIFESNTPLVGNPRPL